MTDDVMKIPGFDEPQEELVEFKVLIKGPDATRTEVWRDVTRFEGSISRRTIYECDEARIFSEEVLRAAGLEDPEKLVVVTMDAAGGDEEEVGPAISHIPFMVDRYAERPDKYIRPPQRIRPALIRAMMRSHWSIIAKEAADQEREVAKADLHELEVEAGMHEPNPWYD
ncbi:MAG TPA: hypothetical protein VHA35_18230 [Dongiaceae bacterium]|nr:hypothetical protein [Dongiaceae bacterium]